MSFVIKLSKDMKMKALKIRNQVCKEDDFELMQKIEDAAEHGEFHTYFVKNKVEEYPTISADMIRGLKRAGYKVHLWDNSKGWDTLHRYYKGALEVKWYK